MPISLCYGTSSSAVRRWRASAPPPGSLASPVTRAVDAHTQVENLEPDDLNLADDTIIAILQRNSLRK
jgi:hypothetical protein